MKWHAQRIRCSNATVLRGYRRGCYEAASPYQALMLVLTRGGAHEVQGFLASERLSKSDIAKLRVACRRHGIRLISTRRRGKVVEVAVD